MTKVVNNACINYLFFVVKIVLQDSPLEIFLFLIESSRTYFCMSHLMICIIFKGLKSAGRTRLRLSATHMTPPRSATL